ncbi:MAG TPA: hypothetical protein VNE21_01880 [Mycobacteriales bacterium]|nr:hypothetical protein [Mycobacteriales bacterium]
MPEPYIRPPLVGAEPAPEWIARWRFRVVAVLALLALVVAAVVLVTHVINAGQNPGIPQGTAPAQQPYR